jgi:truncated hemoglobin YjbI
MEKKKQYMKYLLGGSSQWTGKDIKDIHMPLKITEEHFDLYKNTLTSQLKSMGIRVGPLRQICSKVNELREQIVWDG